MWREKVIIVEIHPSIDQIERASYSQKIKTLLALQDKNGAKNHCVRAWPGPEFLPSP